MLEFILIIIFVLLLIHYIIFLSLIYKGLLKLRPNTISQIPEELVSVIIPFRNESEIILKNLKSIESQDYPPAKYEVIYVNDFSTDDSVEILAKNKNKDNIRIISVPENYSVNAHKKRAVTYGIENSTGDIIVTTDADCIYDESWLCSLLQNFDKETAFVSGPVEFIDDEKFFSEIQKMEFAGLVLTGAGLIGSGNSTICNAANIAYRRKVFNEVDGFNDHLDLSSGDDEFLLQKIASDTKYKIKFSVDKKSVVRTSSNKSIGEFYHQRKRWASKGLFYNDKSLIFKLILIYFFYIGLIAQTFLSIFLSWYFILTLAVSLLLKLFFEFRIMIKGKRLLFPRLSLKTFIGAEFFQIFYIILAGFAGMFGNLQWKERKIKR
ncbi:glycosyltransferase [bacterium BMS3Abin03]|nr:glycosyltransferase [bacterium BMS3Abin03]